MDFNNIWTKEINDECRKLIKEGYTSNMIIEYFGRNITVHHPKKKYSYSKINNFQKFNEIKINSGYVHYSIEKIKSKYYNEIDYKFNFIVNDMNYVLLFLYVENFNTPSYELLFTTEKQYNKYKSYIDKKEKINKLDELYLSSIIEEETGKNELFKLLKSICYIIENEYKNIPYSITETNNDVKINLYKNIFKDTYKNMFIEKVSDSQLNPGKKIYYYIKK